MNLQQPIYQKELRFFKLNPPKKAQDSKKVKVKNLQFIEPQQRRLHEIIRQILKDFQYFSSYQKQQLNLSQGERVLKMNGIKIIKENDTFFIEKYIQREQSVLKKSQKFVQKGAQKSEGLKLQFCKSQTISDPRYFLSLLGYSTKEKDYYKYLQLQCYKCPAYGIEIVIYQKWDQNQYMMIDSVCNYEGTNMVTALLMEKLTDLITEESYINIDPYTLRPKDLKHGLMPDI